LGVIKRQALQSSVLLYVGTIIGFITTGLIAPNVLSKSEIGTLRLLLSYSGIFMSIGVLGFSTVTIRYLNQFYDSVRNNHNGFLGILIIVGILGSIITTIIILIMQPTVVQNNIDKSPQFARYFLLIIPLTIFQIFYSLFDSYNNALLRSSYGVFLRDFVQRMLVFIGLALLFFELFQFHGYTYYYVFAICFPSILMLLHIIWNKAFDIKINFKILNRGLMGSMLSVGVFGLLNSMSSVAALQIDAIMINMYLDDAAVGIYVITFYFGTLVFIPSKALNKIAPALISKAFKEKDIDAVKDIYCRSSQNLFIIGALIYLGLLVNLENIFNIIPKSYEIGKYVIVLIGLANLVKMAGGSSNAIITYSKYYKTTTLFLVIYTVLIVITNFIFIPIFGILGAAIATLASIVIYDLMKFIFIKIKFGFNPFGFQYIIVLIFSTVIYFMVNLIPDPNNFILDIAIDSILTSVLFYLIIWRLPIGRDIKMMIDRIAQNTLEFFRTKY